MTDVRKYVVTAETPIGADVDLTTEELFDSHGNRITEEYVAEAVENVREVQTRRGRPSLSGGAEHSPRVSFRAPAPLHQALSEIAQREGKSVSQVAREAVERYVAG